MTQRLAARRAAVIWALAQAGVSRSPILDVFDYSALERRLLAHYHKEKPR